MACTIEHVLMDARMLVTRLKEHDNSADNLITQTHTLYKRVDAMRQYEEDMNELNNMARHRPRTNLIMGLVQENTQIRELQQENRELRQSLEEHQSALELIMSKYREHVVRLTMANRLDQSSNVIVNSAPPEEVEEKIDKICEMASVMRRAIELDEATETQEQEMVAQLRHENVSLRKLIRDMDLSRCCVAMMVDDDTQTDTSEVATESSDMVTSSTSDTTNTDVDSATTNDSHNTESDSQSTDVDSQITEIDSSSTKGNSRITGDSTNNECDSQNAESDSGSVVDSGLGMSVSESDITVTVCSGNSSDKKDC